MTVGLPICLINMLISFIRCSGECRKTAEKCPRLDKERQKGYKPFKSLDGYMNQDIYKKDKKEENGEESTEDIRGPIVIDTKGEETINN